MDDNNIFYSCECVYFDGGYISCKICSGWVKSSATVASTVEQINLAKRWCRMKRDFKKSKNYFFIYSIVSTGLTSTKK